MRFTAVPATKSTLRVRPLQNLDFVVDKVLHLPRNLHCQAFNVLRTAAATKSAQQDSHHAALPVRFKANALPKASSKCKAFRLGMILLPPCLALNHHTCGV